MELAHPFSTPLWSFRIPDPQGLNAELARALIDESEQVPGVQRVSFGRVWQSEPDLVFRDAPPFRALCAMLASHAEAGLGELAARRGHPQVELDLGLRVWATVMRDGDHVMHHDHEDASFVLQYYPDAGDPPDEAAPSSGVVTFVSPQRVSASLLGLDLFPPSIDVRPHDGLLLMFPGHLQHYVHAYRGRRPRVCVSAALRARVRNAPPPPRGYPSQIRRRIVGVGGRG